MNLTSPKNLRQLLRVTIVSTGLLTGHTGYSLTNGLALAPPMGWNSWNNFGCNINEVLIRNSADAMATNGMKAVGYRFINLDDCWQLSRDPNGVIVADPARFPSGIKALADYVHAKGLLLGLYSDHGLNTCAGRPGGYGYEYLDANTYASWGVDYLKYDNCNLPPGDNSQADYFRMSDALMKSGHPITFSICAWSFSSWAPNLGNLWRTTGDISDSFSSMVSKLGDNSKPAFVAGPGRWNDPDMLEVGRGGMTALEDQAHFTLWCIMAAPLLAGNDLRNMSAQTLSILTNPEVIAVDQDPAGEQGIQVAGSSTLQVWCKPLGANFNTKAVALFNTGTNAASITAAWTNLGLLPGPATVRDLWARTDLGTFTNSFTTNIPAHGAALLKVVGSAAALPAIGTVYLSDLQSAFGYVGWGTMTKDKSIGGNNITLNGTIYSKGLGVHAFSGLEYRLGALPSSLQSDIGVDDEVGVGKGSVVFQVYADGMKVYDSGVMHSGDPHRTINLDLAGVNRLTLGVNDADDGNSYDHADWAGARLTVSGSAPLPPAAPTGLAASPGIPIALSWSAARSATSYNVKRSVAPNGPYTNIASVALPAYNDGDVAAGVTYYYAVSSVNAFGESTNSTPASALACSLPLAPPGLTATASGSQITLSWTAVPGATGYDVTRATSATPFTNLVTGLNTTGYTDTNAAAGMIYYYVVAATNACNQGPFSVALPAALSPPPPTGLAATPANQQVLLTWNAPATSAWFNVKRSGTDGGPYALVAANVSGTSYLDAGLVPGLTYYYVLTEIVAGSESSNSAQVSATPCASSLPVGWTDQDIGSVAYAGSLSSCSGSFILQGDGADIWGSADAFHFTSTNIVGDHTLIARVTTIQNTDPWAKAGLMFRSDATPGSMFVDMFVSPANGVNLQWRSAPGGQCGSVGVGGVTAPVWIKLVRAGTNFYGFYGTDGVNWIQVGATTVPMAAGVRGGFAVTAHNNSTLCLASFDSLAILPMPLPPPLLSLHPDGSQLLLSWPGWATAYTAYGASNLVPPVQWQPMTNFLQTNNGKFNLTLPPVLDQQFFRLGP
jgi:alpha-galactosidase